MSELYRCKIKEAAFHSGMFAKGATCVVTNNAIILINTAGLISLQIPISLVDGIRIYSHKPLIGSVSYAVEIDRIKMETVWFYTNTKEESIELANKMKQAILQHAGVESGV